MKAAVCTREQAHRRTERDRHAQRRCCWDLERSKRTADKAHDQRRGRAPKVETVEGEATILKYFYKSAEKQPSPLQLIRNYQNAIKSIDGAVVYERLPKEGDGGETTLKVATGGKDVWIKVEPDVWSAPTQSYKLSIVEVQAMAQVVSANALLDALNKDGFIALYINFDTGKSVLKADGEATVKEIAAMLKAAPALKISIEGHTDNVGTPASNQKLSEARAKAVQDYLLSKSIAAERLRFKGFGESQPLEPNDTPAGRARNRRTPPAAFALRSPEDPRIRGLFRKRLVPAGLSRCPAFRDPAAHLARLCPGPLEHANHGLVHQRRLGEKGHRHALRLHQARRGGSPAERLRCGLQRRRGVDAEGRARQRRSTLPRHVRRADRYHVRCTRRRRAAARRPGAKTVGSVCDSARDARPVASARLWHRPRRTRASPMRARRDALRRPIARRKRPAHLRAAFQRHGADSARHSSCSRIRPCE
ncbi:MAG: OmpA family protein [Rhodospirillales bacterium]|nr:OmpA family protein [Rhodospirillales bacterium]